MSEIKVSIVIPAYNEEAIIAASLLSLRNHDTDDYELIVVDNASTDKTAKIAEEYADKVVYEERKGVAYARQRGFQEASGSIIASTDADTITEKNWVDEIRRTFMDGIVGAYGPVYLFDGTPLDKRLAKYGFASFLMINCMLGFPHFSGQNFAVRRKDFHAIRGFNITLKSAEDVDLSLRLKKIGKIHFNQKMIVYTSARRLNIGYWQFLKHHISNYFSMLFFGKGREFEDIR